MPFNITEFKSSVVSTELMRSHSYEVYVTPPVGGAQVIRLRTESVSTPGASFMSVDGYRPYGYGKTYTLPYASNLQEITMTHMVDAKSEIIQLFYDWTNLIVDYGSNRQFHAYYHDTYAVPMQIVLYDLKGVKRKTYNISQAFPISVDQGQLSWASNDEILKLNVTYKFSEYTVE